MRGGVRRQIISAKAAARPRSADDPIIQVGELGEIAGAFGMCLGMPFYVARPHIMADEFVPGHLGDSFGLLPFAHGNPLADEFHGPFLVGLIRKEVPHSSGFPFKIEGCDPHIPSCCHERHYAPQLSPVNRRATHESPLPSHRPASCLSTQEGSLRGSGAFCLWRPKTVSWSAAKARLETQFACDRNRFACKDFERNWDTMVSSEL
jgi:hypothetical protein